jgi:hypothetical protein
LQASTRHQADVKEEMSGKQDPLRARSWKCDIATQVNSIVLIDRWMECSECLQIQDRDMCCSNIRPLKNVWRIYRNT